MSSSPDASRMTCSTYWWARGSCSGARTFSAAMSRSNWNCWIAAKLP